MKEANGLKEDNVKTDAIGFDNFFDEELQEKGSSNTHIVHMEEKETPIFPNTSEGHKMKQMWFKLLKKTFTTPIKQNKDGSIVKGRFFVEYFTEVDKVTKIKVDKFKYIRL